MRSFIHLHPHRKLQIIIVIFLVSWLVGTFLIHQFESAQNWSYFDAFYFTVITTATIGFWDYIPHSIAGKILTMMYACLRSAFSLFYDPDISRETPEDSWTGGIIRKKYLQHRKRYWAYHRGYTSQKIVNYYWFYDRMSSGKWSCMDYRGKNIGIFSCILKLFRTMISTIYCIY